jgi:hypothetical protein
MKLWETFRFEVVYQSRRVSTWFYFVLLLALSFQMARGLRRRGAGGQLLRQRAGSEIITGC